MVLSLGVPGRRQIRRSVKGARLGEVKAGRGGDSRWFYRRRRSRPGKGDCSASQPGEGTPSRPPARMIRTESSPGREARDPRDSLASAQGDGAWGEDGHCPKLPGNSDCGEHQAPAHRPLLDPAASHVPMPPHSPPPPKLGGSADSGQHRAQSPWPDPYLNPGKAPQPPSWSRAGCGKPGVVGMVLAAPRLSPPAERERRFR